ncbi:MAG: hypothetical protein KatS3mg121_0329 [Gammaproteobacteria bacterium]|nr:MAG: hypothetical protein KatS3mg121_0329 [Gammaproteobacteria bacterium]
MADTTTKVDLPCHDPASAPEGARDTLRPVQSRLGFLPRLYGNRANPPALLHTDLAGQDGFRRDSGLNPVEQEVVLLTLSRFHGCRYCMAAHSMIAERMSGVPAPILAALREGTALADARLEALRGMTVALLESRGRGRRHWAPFGPPATRTATCWRCCWRSRSRS